MTAVYILEMDRSETVDPSDRHYAFQDDLPEETMLMYVYAVREGELEQELIDRILRGEVDGQPELAAAFAAGKPVYDSLR